MAINKDRELSIGFKVAQNIKTSKINAFIVQYYYNDDKQFKREFRGLCK